MISGIFEEKNCWIYELYLLCQRFMLMIDVLKQFSLGQTVLLGCYWGTNTITWEKKVSQYSTKQSKQNFSQDMNNFFFLYLNFNHQPKVVFFFAFQNGKIENLTKDKPHNDQHRRFDGNLLVSICTHKSTVLQTRQPYWHTHTLQTRYNTFFFNHSMMSFKW